VSWLTDDDDDGAYAQYDESSAKVRPNPKGNKPRSKNRPEHADAVVGRVFSVDRGRYGVWVAENTPQERQIIAAKARDLGRTPEGKGSVVTGDWVDLVGDVSGEPGTLARMVRIHPRQTLLRRSADDTDAVERIIVANADQMLIVVAAKDPEPRPRLVDRYLVAAFDAGVTPILAITKTDLADPAEFLANFAGLDLTVIQSRSDAPPIDELSALLQGHTTVAVGHSGVGKSTLVNALVPDANRATGRVNDVTGRGRHTSARGGSSTPPACGRSAWDTWTLPTSCARSPTSPNSRSSARAAAPTFLTHRTARSSRACRRGGWARSGGCGSTRSSGSSLRWDRDRLLSQR
jgi:ribosome biogenesis GTPase